MRSLVVSVHGAELHRRVGRRASELSHIGTHNVLSKGKDRAQHKVLQTFALSVAYKACNMATHHQVQCVCAQPIVEGESCGHSCGCWLLLLLHLSCCSLLGVCV